MVVRMPWEAATQVRSVAMRPGVPSRAIVLPAPSEVAASPGARWLPLARVAWLVVAAFAFGLFIAGIPAQLARLQVPCPAVSCASGQLPPAALRALGELGLTPGFYAGYAVALNVAFMAAYGGVAALILRRGPAGRGTLITALALLTFPASFGGTSSALAAAHPAWAPAVAALDTLGSAMFTLFLFLFPDGRYVPRWTRWVVLAWIAQQASAALLPALPLAVGDWPVPAQLATVVGLLGTAIYAQGYRYRRVSDEAQRRQTRLVVLGLAIALVSYPVIVLALALLDP